MNAERELRRIDYYDYYSSKISALDRYIRQHAAKGHGRIKLRQTHRLYRNGSRPRGLHDYNNLQWDPSIFRGRTFRDFREKNMPPNTTTVNFTKYCCFGCNTTVGPSMNRRGKTVIGLPRLKVGGVIRPTTDDIMFEESSGRKRHKQDESRKEMEPFIVEQLETPEYAENGSQSDEIKEAPRKTCHHIAIGTSTATQADICILGTGSQEDPLKPVLDSMGSKVLEQSLLETFEEYELHSIRSEIRGLMEKRRYRQARQMKEVEHQLFKAEMIEWDRIRRERELHKELEADEMIAAIMYSINACNYVLAFAFNNLRQHRFLVGENHDVVQTFNPWLHQQMYRHLQIPRMIVNDIIQNVENDRLLEFNLRTLLSQGEDAETQEQELDSTRKSQTEEEEEEDDASSLGPPPNTASTLPYSASEGEDDGVL